MEVERHYQVFIASIYGSFNMNISALTLFESYSGVLPSSPTA
jgi:hypothetical protein